MFSIFVLLRSIVQMETYSILYNLQKLNCGNEMNQDTRLKNYLGLNKVKKSRLTLIGFYKITKNGPNTL